MFDRFLSAPDAGRAIGCFQKLARHDVSSWALTGGLAVEIHRVRCGRDPRVRALNDVDFIASSFDRIPNSLAEGFLFRHIHPFDPPGRTLLQAVDPDNRVRVDLFRACGDTMKRTVPLGSLQLISLEDLAARTARLVLDLASGMPTPEKHARDFRSLLDLIDPSKVESVWREHRRQQDPASFTEAAPLLEKLIEERRNLLITPRYSTDPSSVCGRCQETNHFRLASPHAILSLLGYC